MVVRPEKELGWDTIGLLLYPGFEPLDVYGPLQIFGALTKSPWKRARRLITIAEEEGPVESSMGVATVATHSVDTAPPCDVIVVPGGIGSRVSMHNPVLINFLRQRYADERLQHLMTVCTGTTLLSNSGLLDGRRATTNKIMFGYVSSLNPRVQWVRHGRWVQDGRVLTTSGVSAGMDGALFLIAQRFGEEIADSVSVYTEYDGNWRDAEVDPFDPALHRADCLVAASCNEPATAEGAVDVLPTKTSLPRDAAVLDLVASAT